LFYEFNDTKFTENCQHINFITFHKTVVEKCRKLYKNIENIHRYSI